MNVRSIQLSLNSFHGYGVLKLGAHLELICGSVANVCVNFGDYPLQHKAVNVLELLPLLCFVEDTLTRFP